MRNLNNTIKETSLVLFVLMAFSLKSQKPEIRLEEPYRKHPGIFKLRMNDSTHSWSLVDPVECVTWIAKCLFK
jgi:hypothetical protein